jgi:hypothetical protein
MILPLERRCSKLCRDVAATFGHGTCRVQRRGPGDDAVLVPAFDSASDYGE